MSSSRPLCPHHSQSWAQLVSLTHHADAQEPAGNMNSCKCSLQAISVRKQCTLCIRPISNAGQAFCAFLHNAFSFLDLFLFFRAYWRTQTREIKLCGLMCPNGKNTRKELHAGLQEHRAILRHRASDSKTQLWCPASNNARSNVTLKCQRCQEHTYSQRY